MTHIKSVRLIGYLAVVISILAWPTLSFGQLTVILSGGFAGPYQEAIQQFEQGSGISITTLTGGSRGDDPNTIGAQLARGIKADVVILSRSGLPELITQGRIVKGSDRDLACTLISVAIRAGGLKRDIRTVDALRKTLIDAKTLAVTGSGAASSKILLARLGIADQVVARVAGRVADTITLVARGEVGLAIMPASETANMPGVEFAGAIPVELQRPSIYAAAIVSGTSQQHAADQLINYLLSDALAAVLEKFRMER